MDVCKECAGKNGLVWDIYEIHEATCDVCKKPNSCKTYTINFVKGISDDVFMGQISPIYQMYDGEYIDLSKLFWIGSVHCAFSYLEIYFYYLLFGHKYFFRQSHKMANNEIATTTVGKEVKTFIKLVDGSLVSQNETQEVHIKDVFAVKVFEEERQKLITAWKTYRRFSSNKELMK